MRGAAGPTRFFHPNRRIAVAVHGHDFLALATDENLSWYEANLKNACELGDCTRLGPCPHHSKEIRILNRILKIDADGLKWDADPRHLELLAKSLDLEACRKESIPGDNAKDPIDAEHEKYTTPHGNDPQLRQAPNSTLRNVQNIQNRARMSKRGVQ